MTTIDYILGGIGATIWGSVLVAFIWSLWWMDKNLRHAAANNNMLQPAPAQDKPKGKVLTPDSIHAPARDKRFTITVSQREVWISKPSFNLMGLPSQLKFHLLPSTLAVEVSGDGFEVKQSSVRIGDYAIYRTALCREILNRFNATKVQFQVLPHGNVFELRPFNIEMQ